MTNIDHELLERIGRAHVALQLWRQCDETLGDGGGLMEVKS